METASQRGPRLIKSLSAQLLLLTVAFVMLAEVLIYVPSVARFRITSLEQRIQEAHLAAMSLLAVPNFVISPEFERELLAAVDAKAVVLRQPATRILIQADAMPPTVAASYDLGRRTVFGDIVDAFQTMFAGDDRIIRVLGKAEMRPGTLVEIVMAERPLRAAMLIYSWNILTLSLFIALITAGLLFLTLQWRMVRPMRRITASMVKFRRAPEDAASAISASARNDEIGTAERELAEMQGRLRLALKQKTRLAELGAAVSKVNHDLRNILATAQLVSDRLTLSDDPEVRGVTPRLIDAIDRAINLCQRTLRYGSAAEPEPVRTSFQLGDLVDDVGASIGLPSDGRVSWQNRITNGLAVDADRDQLFRVLLNLGRNAMQAIAGDGAVTIQAERTDDGVVIEVRDTGPGLPNVAREHLFEAFTGSARAGGTGLGLAIARDLMRAHGGNIELLRSDADGTAFRLFLPGPDA